MDAKQWHFRALTDIWTGDAQGKSDRLIPTGLIGSIRWWFEVLVRGLGGKVCDPTVDGVRCPSKNVRNPHHPGHHCVVCEFFGCTGWARKFRMMVLDENGQVIENKIRADQTFILCLIPLRPMRAEEWCLLDTTLRLIADYGAISGKTVFKPSDEKNRQSAFHHKDFGLVQYIQGPENWWCGKTRGDIESYIANRRWRSDFDDSAFAWASLQNFWCVKGRYLARQDTDRSIFNQIIGREQAKGQAQQLAQNTAVNRWLAGRQRESKKVFSFKHSEKGKRTFGFVKPNLVDFEAIKYRLKNVWTDFDPNQEFLTGDQIFNGLFSREGGGA